MAKRKSTKGHELQNITQKTKDRATRTSLKTGDEHRCPLVKVNLQMTFKPRYLHSRLEVQRCVG